MYKETAKEKGTQIIFLNRGRNNDTGVDLYRDLVAKLVKSGIPENQIVSTMTYPEKRANGIIRESQQRGSQSSNRDFG